MRLRIPDEIIELAKEHPDKKVEIYGATVSYILHNEMIYRGLAEYLDPNIRRSKKMKGKQNRLGHTIIKSGTDLNLSVGHSINKSGTVLNNKSGTHLKSKAKPKKKCLSEESLTIYISNNKQIYDIVYKYIYSNIDTGNIQYLINKQGENQYIYTQMLEAEKIIKKVGFDTFVLILTYIKQDEFRNQQILSIAKLNRKNKDGVPYYVVIMDKIKNSKPNVISIPTV